MSVEPFLGAWVLWISERGKPPSLTLFYELELRNRTLNAGDGHVDCGTIVAYSTRNHCQSANPREVAALAPTTNNPTFAPIQTPSVATNSSPNS